MHLHLHLRLSQGLGRRLSASSPPSHPSNCLPLLLPLLSLLLLLLLLLLLIPGARARVVLRCILGWVVGLRGCVVSALDAPWVPQVQTTLKMRERIAGGQVHDTRAWDAGTHGKKVWGRYQDSSS